MDVGNNVMGAEHTLVNVGNDGVRVQDLVANIGNDYVCVYCEFSLEPDN